MAFKSPKNYNIKNEQFLKLAILYSLLLTLVRFIRYLPYMLYRNTQRVVTLVSR